jgi:hypothetical protein
MNGRDRLPRERMRPSRMCRSSSRVITVRARGALLPVFTMTCTVRQAFVRRRTLCQDIDHWTLSGRPTAAHLAAFILPSLGRSASPTLPYRHYRDVVRIPAMNAHASHCGLRSNDLGTNKLSTGDFTVDGCALDTRDDGTSSAVRWSLGRSLDSLAGGRGFDGNSALTNRARAPQLQRPSREQDRLSEARSRMQCRGIRWSCLSACRSRERVPWQRTSQPHPQI